MKEEDKIIKYIKKNKKIYLDSFALKTKLPIIEAQRLLNKLLEENNGDVRVDKNGKLIYVFDEDLRESENLLKFIFDMIKGVLRLFRDLFVSLSKTLMLLIFISYGAVYAIFLMLGFLFSSLLFGIINEAGRRDSLNSVYSQYSYDNFDLDGYMTDFFEMLNYAFTLKSFHEEGYYGKRKSFHVKVFSFVFGDDYNRKEFKNDENVLKFVKKYKKITLSDVINLTGLKENEAKHLILSLVVKYDGEIKVSDGGVLYYDFPYFDFRGIKGGFSYIWERKLKEVKLNQNDDETNTKIIIFGIINLLLSTLVSFGILENISFLPEDILEYLEYWYGYLALFYSVIFFVIPIIRLPFVKLKNKIIDKINYVYYLFNDFSYNLDRDYVDMDETDDEAEEYLFENYPNIFIHDFINGKDVIDLRVYHEELRFSSDNNPENIKIYDPDDVDFLSGMDDDDW